jgi:hypothetical protein
MQASAVEEKTVTPAKRAALVAMAAINRVIISSVVSSLRLR